MTLPTITRAIGFRDDFLVTTSWVPGNTANVGLPTQTTDGDFDTLTVVFTSAVSGNNGSLLYSPITALDTNKYRSVMIRHKDGGIGTNPSFILEVWYSDGSHDSFTLTASSSLIAETFTLTSGKITDHIFWKLQATANLTGTFTATTDFIQIFKETLTLPSVTRATPVPAKIYLVKIPILLKEGDALQHIGSSSPEFQLGGSLITTSQYSADDWNRVLDGLRLEQATIQADGNPTWQWFNHDLWQRKVMIGDYVPIDVPGRTRNTMNDYNLRLVEWDTISQTASAINAIQ